MQRDIPQFLIGKMDSVDFRNLSCHFPGALIGKGEFFLDHGQHFLVQGMDLIALDPKQDEAEMGHEPVIGNIIPFQWDAEEIFNRLHHILQNGRLPDRFVQVSPLGFHGMDV